MGQSKYVYTFVPSGMTPNDDTTGGTTKGTCMVNARLQASVKSLSQDVYRRACYNDGRYVLGSSVYGWERVTTVRAKDDTLTREQAVARECIQAITAAMPPEVDASPVRFRRQGMTEAIQAIKRHWVID